MRCMTAECRAHKHVDAIVLSKFGNNEEHKLTTITNVLNFEKTLKTHQKTLFYIKK